MLLDKCFIKFLFGDCLPGGEMKWWKQSRIQTMRKSALEIHVRQWSQKAFLISRRGQTETPNKVPVLSSVLTLKQISCLKPLTEPITILPLGKAYLDAELPGQKVAKKLIFTAASEVHFQNTGC